MALTVQIASDFGYESSSGFETPLHILTGFLILYPIAAGITLVACLTALAASRIGSAWSVVFASIASVVTLAAVIATFILFTVSIIGRTSLHASC